MSKIVQLAGGSRESQDQYTGPEREVTVDTDNDELRLHDGKTPGGHPIFNVDQNDKRYQKRNDELDGLIGFEPQQRGFLVRRGPADYRMRKVEVESSTLSVANADGYNGNPQISLRDIIDKVLTFAKDIAFSGKITVAGGVDGDTRGTHTGNVVGNVLGDVVGNLTGNAAGNHSGTFTGSIDTTDGLVAMGDGQIRLAYLHADVIEYIQARSVKPGTMQIWSGSIASIPAGYALCDGSNGTPNLENCFIMGAGSSTNPGLTGGSVNHTHTITIPSDGGEHLHEGRVGATSLTIEQMPAHFHGNGVVDKDTSLYNHGSMNATPQMSRSIDGNKSDGRYEGYTTTVGAGEPHDHQMTVEMGGPHGHTATAAESSNLPPFYAFAIIMKLPYDS